ncbi:MAG: alpha/beta fold hydrolase [Betaproteobacteria bacterium]
MRRLAILLLSAATLVACGQSSPAAHPAAPVVRPSPATPTAATGSSGTAQPCPSGGVVTATVGGGRISVSLVGGGAVTVVLSNQSDEDRCSWMPFANILVANGYRVALWDYGGGDPRTELSAVTAALAASPHQGSGAIVLMGASKGAKTSLLTARADHPAHLVGVVSLSAESTLAPNIDVAQGSAGLATPTLLITAVDDDYGSAEALPTISRGLSHAQVLRVPGSDHGTALLDDSGVTPTVLAFLHAVSAG